MALDHKLRTRKAGGLDLSQHLKDLPNTVGRILTRFKPISCVKTDKNQNLVIRKLGKARRASSKDGRGFSPHLRASLNGRMIGGPSYDRKREILRNQFRYRAL
jgi:hypothetical protein